MKTKLETEAHPEGKRGRVITEGVVWPIAPDSSATATL